jgi:REP element-mobilizing transposase RayT
MFGADINSRGRLRRTQPQAGLLPFPGQHGGSRAGAGRKPKGDTAGVSHRERAALASRFPVHVTVKLQRALPRLRQRAEYAALRAAFTSGCTGGASAAAGGAFRLCHYAILNDHLHFLVEARDRAALSRGLQGLMTRIAKALNKLWNRRGKVFADRYHDRILRTPREVRNAIRYVLGNAKKHHAQGGVSRTQQVIDTYTSAPWFDGFRERVSVCGLEAVVRPVTDARTWMLTIGWRRHGLLSVHDVPASA